MGYDIRHYDFARMLQLDGTGNANVNPIASSVFDPKARWANDTGYLICAIDGYSGGRVCLVYLAKCIIALILRFKLK